MPGHPTTMLVYEVQQDGHVITNPIFRIQRGATFAADLLNAMDESTTIHWHGFHIPWQMDGHPLNPVAPGATYRYQFTVQNRGGTYWYHPHAHGATARQTYLGLTGMFLIEDGAERAVRHALDLAWGETDLPLLLQDKTFGADGSLTYQPDPMIAAMGLEGDTILTNLMVDPYLEVGTRLYRFRVLNGANARIFRLAFVTHPSSEQLPSWVIATDGHLLDRPYQVTEVFLSPGERVDLLLDLAHHVVGNVILLKSLAFDPMHHEMDHGTHEVTSASHHARMLWREWDTTPQRTPWIIRWE